MEPAAEFLGMAGPVAAQLPTDGPDGSDAAVFGALRRRAEATLGPDVYAAALARGGARPYDDLLPAVEDTLARLLAAGNEPG